MPGRRIPVRAPRRNSGLPLLVILLAGGIGGAAAGFDSCVQSKVYETSGIALRVCIGAVLGMFASGVTDFLTRALLGSFRLKPDGVERFLRYDLATFVVFLLPLAGIAGLRMLPPLIVAAAFALAAMKAILFILVTSPEDRRRLFASVEWLAFLFLLSGVAALVYQVVWQRALFAAFGINIESITIVVALFMFGLGLGSLLGGLAAKRYPGHLLRLFVSCELGIGLFGAVSLPLIDRVSALTLHGSRLTVTSAIFALLCLPTMLMGATLPILVTHLFRKYNNLGQSVGILYFINTLGSALSCFLVADGLFSFVGQQATVFFAVACNVTVAVLAAWYARGLKGDSPAIERGESVA